LKTSDIFWLAGLLEGEGCFGLSGAGGSIRISLNMTDLDIVERAANLLGGQVKKRKLSPNRKQVYSTEIFSNRAAAWMMTLFPIMGDRRKDKIEESLNYWKQQRFKNQSGKGRRNPRRASERLA
jgi:hypothetical protein